jgi:hypothetical protein
MSAGAATAALTLAGDMGFIKVARMCLHVSAGAKLLR